MILKSMEIQRQSRIMDISLWETVPVFSLQIMYTQTYTLLENVLKNINIKYEIL